MAQAITPYRREITQKAWLLELNCAFATQVGCLYAHHLLLEPGTRTTVDELVQEAAQSVLSKPPYADQRELLKKVIANAEVIYRDFKFGVPSDDEKIPLLNRPERWTNSIIRRGAIQLLRANGSEVIELNQSEIPPFAKLKGRLEKISCYEYALMRAGVEEAFFDHCWKEEDLLELLPKWGFNPISKDASRPGDLVLYLKEGKPGHLGIRFKKEILSKPGNNQEFAHVHTIDETFTSWGDEVLFFTRKR